MNTEYFYWKNLFQTTEFYNYLLQLKTKLRNKKVIIYSNGIYFDALCDCFNLNDFFNIIGISDIRYENTNEKNYKNFTCIKPSEFELNDFDYILVSSPNFKKINMFLKKYNLKQKTLHLSYFQNSLKTKIKNCIDYLKIDKNLFKVFKYFIFCSTEQFKTKLNYEKILLKLKTKEKIRALFICEESSKWSWQKVYDELKTHKRFDVLPVLLFPIVTKNRIEYTQKSNVEFFKKQNTEAIDGYNYEQKMNRDIKEFAPDIVFYQQPWYLIGKNHPIEVSNYALTIMAPYGYTTLSPKHWGSFLVNRVYSTLWKFFSESPYHNKFYETAADMKFKDILYSTGSLKLDEYRKKITTSNIWKSSGKRIIWAPHHSINNDGLKMGTFRENHQFFLNFAKEHSEYSFLLKPHPVLRNVCKNSDIDYDKFIEEWCSLDNATVYAEGDYFDIFKSSDLLITDCSSFLAEYFPSQKPLILIDRQDRAPFDDFGNKIKKGLYIANTTLEIEKYISQLLVNNNDNLKKTRLKIIEKYIYFPQKPTYKIILDYLQKTLSKQDN